MYRSLLVLQAVLTLVRSQPCPLNWLFIDDNCYYVKTQGDRTWYGASAFCSQVGGKLVNIDSMIKQVEVKELLSGYPGFDWWIDIHRLTGNSREWNDEISLNFFGEEKVEQHAGNGEQCVFVSSDDGMWYWSSCQDMKRYICEKKSNSAFVETIDTDRSLPDAAWMQNNIKDSYTRLYGDMMGLLSDDDKGLPRDNTTTESPSTTSPGTETTPSTTSTEAATTEPANVCQDEGWLMLDSMCYKLFLDGKNWTLAEQHCGYHGGHLAGFSSQQVQTSWNDKYNFHSGSIWIGVHKNLDGIWYWAQNDSLAYLSWSQNALDEQDNDKNCGSLTLHTNTWNKEYCSSLKAFACYRGVDVSSSIPPSTVSPGTTATITSPCGSSDWVTNGDSCYFTNINDDSLKPTTFYAAQDECRKRSSNLVILTNSDDNNFVLNEISSGGLPAWVGLSRLGKADGFTWLDGSSPTYLAWTNDSSPNLKYRKCVSMHFESGKWEKIDCNAHLNYVCQKPKIGSAFVPSTSSPVQKVKCPSGWQLFNKNKCIQIGTSPKSWLHAQATCRAVSSKADLVSVNTAVDQAYLTMAVRNISESYWIGLKSRKHYGNFFSWSDESRFNFTSWAAGQPSAHCDSCPSTCGLVSGGESREPGVWFDVDCRHTYAYICQQPSEPDPSAHEVVKKCPPPHSDYTLVGDICYKVVLDVDKWNDANSYCKSQRGSLAYVKDAYTNAALIVLLRGTTSTNFWLGLSDQAIFGKMEWTAPWPASSDYAPWTSASRRGQVRDSCATIDVTTGLWNYNDCSSYNSYVCMYAPDLAGNVSSDGCPSDRWKQSASKCYILSDEGITARWSEAKDACENEGYQLAVISNKDDQMAIRHLTGTLTTEYNAWIGLYRTGYSGFDWVDHSGVNFLSWESGQPSYAKCATAVKNSQGRWSTIPCTYYRPYICMTPRNSLPTPSMQSSTGAGGWSVFGVICLVAGVLILVGVLANVLVKHFFFSWNGLLQSMPGTVFKPTARPQGHHSVENLSYHHEENLSAGDQHDESNNATHENNELNRWGSDQELVS